MYCLEAIKQLTIYSQKKGKKLGFFFFPSFILIFPWLLGEEQTDLFLMREFTLYKILPGMCGGHQRTDRLLHGHHNLLT